MFPLVDTAYTKEYAEFSGDYYCLILGNRQYHRGVDTTYTKRYEISLFVDTAHAKQWAVLSLVDTAILSN